MIHTEYLIIGQGISGTWLSFYLRHAGKDFLVIDEEDPNASSRIAAGVINPVTGRRHVSTWMAEELLPYAEDAYHQLGDMIGVNAISKKSIIDFFPTAQMRVSFMDRMEESPFLHQVEDENKFLPLLQYELGCAQVSPVYLVNLGDILPSWRNELRRNNQILAEKFDVALLGTGNGKVNYKNISAERIIFCDGISSMNYNWFSRLPFAPNKGEILIAEIPGLPKDQIYKRGMVLVPLEEPDLFWIGASYEWDFNTVQPTEEFRKRTDALLKSFLKLPYRIIDHKAGIRNATLERRPFVGLHPEFPRIAILNGMGTKGCSLAPYFAKQLTEHLVHGTPIDPQADIARFKKTLTPK